MALSEKFCLRWNDFESNISDAFKDLREQKDFFDVTLACDDSQIEAHKVILSACSPFFRNILRRNPHQHPLLYIKGVKYKELVAVLNFMYMGEVNVVQEELNSFLVVAEELRVKGLTQNNSPNEPSHKPNNSQEHHRPIDRPRAPPEKAKVFSPIRPKPAPTSQASVPLIKPIANSFVPNDDDDIQEVAPVKSEPQEEPPQPALQNFVEIPHPEPQVDFQSQAEDMERNTIAVDESFVVDESYNYEQYYDDGSELMNQGAGTPMGATDANKDAIQSKMGKNIEGQWQCTDCEYASQHSTNVRNHIEVNHMASVGYFCQHCDKFCKTKNALNLHRSRYKHY